MGSRWICSLGTVQGDSCYLLWICGKLNQISVMCLFPAQVRASRASCAPPTRRPGRLCLQVRTDLTPNRRRRTPELQHKPGICSQNERRATQISPKHPTSVSSLLLLDSFWRGHNNEGYLLVLPVCFWGRRWIKNDQCSAVKVELVPVKYFTHSKINKSV